MQEKSGTPASALWTAAHVGDCGAVSRLIAEGVDVNVWDQWGRSALLFAASAGHLDVATILVDAGAWVNPHEDYDIYDTPLMHAASNGNAAMVSFLLGAGADPTLHAGVAQQTAEGYARHTYPDIAALLRKAEDAKRA